jgi:hypothetical protein
MIRTKLILLGLCAALFGVMAFGASGAQAAEWLILMSNNEVLTATQLLANIQAKVEVTPVLHTEILKVKFLVVCTGVSLIGIGLEAGGKLTEGGKVSFTGCKGETNGSPNANCTPHAGGGAAGVVNTNEGKGELVLHELEGGTKDGLTKIEPKTGTTFVTLEMSEACPVGEKVPVNGVLFLKDCENMIELHLKEHLIEEGPLTDLWATNTKNAEHKAVILGSAWIRLIGVGHEGLLWGADV